MPGVLGWISVRLAFRDLVKGVKMTSAGVTFAISVSAGRTRVLSCRDFNSLPSSNRVPSWPDPQPILLLSGAGDRFNGNSRAMFSGKVRDASSARRSSSLVRCLFDSDGDLLLRAQARPFQGAPRRSPPHLHRRGYDARPFGGIDITISRADPATGIIAVAGMLQPAASRPRGISIATRRHGLPAHTW
jgi:hypothetical protein